MTVGPVTQAATPRPLTAARLISSGWAASVPVAILTTLAVLLAPHVRGVGFFPVLRFAVVVPVCIGLAIASAWLYRGLAARTRRARARLAGALVAGALVVSALSVGFGPAGFVAGALPAVWVAALGSAYFVPRALERTRRSRAGAIVLALFGALELLGVACGLRSERAAPASAEGLPFAVPRALFDVDHEFVELASGARVHYVDEGSGPVLLFLHGNPAWSFQWRELIHALRGSYRCVALDYPGFGMSDAPAGFGHSPREQSGVVEEFVDRLGLRDVTLVMQDWGGPIGIGMAERRPELVRGLILGSTWAWPTDTSTPRGKFSLIAGGPIGEFAQVNFNAFVAFGVDNGVVRELPAEVMDLYLDPFRALARRGVAAFYPGQIVAANAYFSEVEANLSRVADKPALIFWALRDLGFPREDLERFERSLPDHRTVELADADHFFFEDSAERMVTEIGSFMATARPAATSPR